MEKRHCNKEDGHSESQEKKSTRVYEDPKGGQKKFGQFLAVLHEEHFSVEKMSRVRPSLRVNGQSRADPQVRYSDLYIGEEHK